MNSIFLGPKSPFFNKVVPKKKPLPDIGTVKRPEMASYMSPHVDDRHGSGCDGTTSRFLNRRQAESDIRTTWLMGNEKNFKDGRLVVELDHKKVVGRNQGRPCRKVRVVGGLKNKLWYLVTAFPFFILCCLLLLK